MKIVGIIPSRMESSRLPGKPLLDIDGLPMLVHVLKRAQMSKVLDRVIVATDSLEIQNVILAQGGEVSMTSRHHRTGTDRIAEAARKIDADIVVNIQGDEPLLQPEHIDASVAPLLSDPALQASVLVAPFTQRGRTSVIKAALDLCGNILYCSRSDIPDVSRGNSSTMWKMSFIVLMRAAFLEQFAAWDCSPLETVESVEHLRILEHGIQLRAVPVDHAEISVDTPADLDIVRELMKRDTLRHKYNRISS